MNYTSIFKNETNKKISHTCLGFLIRALSYMEFFHPFGSLGVYIPAGFRLDVQPTQTPLLWLDLYAEAWIQASHTLRILILSQPQF